MGTQAHDTSSMHNFAQQHQARAAVSDAPPASAQTLHSAYPYSHDNAYAAQPAQAAANVDVQALLDSLTPATHNAPTGQYAAPNASLPSATTLPPRPPTQDQPATHPNYNPSDDIASYHPQNQRAPNAQQRGNGAPQPSNPHSHQPGHAQQQPGVRSETPDDEDQRWPPEVNRRYEEFLEQERRFVTEGQWDQFPMGSRLFIGKYKAIT